MIMNLRLTTGRNLSLITLCMASVTIGYGQSDISNSRVDFYINLNECMNCHAFLKNHLTTVEGVDTLNIHMDRTAIDIGMPYLHSRGIDTTVFDQIYYEDLLAENDGMFESYMVKVKNGVRDTVKLIEPLVFDFAQVIVDTEAAWTKTQTDCGKTSNRVDIFSMGEQFVVVDYLFNQTYLYRTLRDKIVSCRSDIFHLEDNIPFYEDHIERGGWSLELTHALGGLLRQIGRDNSSVKSVGLKGDALLGLVAVPYVFASGNDTLVSTIMLLQQRNGDVLGAFNNGTERAMHGELYEMGYDLSFSDGVMFDDDTLLVPLFKTTEAYQHGDKFIGRFVSNDVGVFTFIGFAKYELPESTFSRRVPLRFNENVLYFTNLPYVFDRLNAHATEIKFEAGGTPDKLYEVWKNEGDDRVFELCYSLDDVLYYSQYDPRSETNTVIWEHPLEPTSYPVVQRTGVFVLQEG